MNRQMLIGSLKSDSIDSMGTSMTSIVSTNTSNHDDTPAFGSSDPSTSYIPSHLLNVDSRTSSSSNAGFARSTNSSSSSSTVKLVEDSCSAILELAATNIMDAEDMEAVESTFNELNHEAKLIEDSISGSTACTCMIELVDPSNPTRSDVRVSLGNFYQHDN